jgi:uncharacterized protein (TIGR02594 family)
MTLGSRKAMLLLCAAAIAGFSGAASARPFHHHRHHSHHRAVHINTQAAAAAVTNSDTNQRLQFQPETQAMAMAPATGERQYSRRSRRAARASVAEPTASASLLGGLSGNSLVADARRYIGTNPTGRSSLWCGAFMDKVLKDAGLPGGGNLALGYLHYGHRVAGPQVGAIAVMGRRRGGHVGVVSGLDPNGNPIIVSGNHNRTVAESVYPRGRIIAYVMPGG